MTSMFFSILMSLMTVHNVKVWKSILVECESDMILVQVAGVDRRYVEHARGKGNICRKAQRFSGMIALMDEDPWSTQPKYIEHLLSSQKVQKQHDILLLHDTQRDNRIILLSPRLEEWVIKSAHAVHVKLETYNLPSSANALHRLVNQRLHNWKSLLQDLIETSPRLQYFQTLFR